MRGLVCLIFCFCTSSCLAQDIFIRDILLSGNKRTKEVVIYREIPFQKGDSLSEAKLDELISLAERNLNNTELFSSVEITKVPGFDNGILILIEFVEQWYIFPLPIFQLADPNFNIWWETKDFSRANYGMNYLDRNFRGRNERLSLRFQIGYSESFRFQYQIPGINKKRTLGLIVDGEYTQFGEVTVQTENNERIFFDDNSGKSKEQSRFGVGVTYRPNYNTDHLFYIGFDSYKVVDSLRNNFPDHLNFGQRKMAYAEMAYRLRNNCVDFIPYPLKGIDWEFELQVKGINDIPENLMANTFLRLAVHNRLSERWSVHNGFRYKRTFYDELPYTLQRGLGYNDVQVRGYGLYLVDGQSYYLFRNNLRYNIIKPSVFVLGKKQRKFTSFPYAFYLNAFVDFAYVDDELYAPQNFLDNRWIGGWGIGIDMLTKYNRVFRIEFAFNDINEQGLFLQVRKSI